MITCEKCDSQMVHTTNGDTTDIRCPEHGWVATLYTPPARMMIEVDALPAEFVNVGNVDATMDITKQYRVCAEQAKDRHDGMHGLCCTGAHLLGTVCPLGDCDDPRCRAGL